MWIVLTASAAMPARCWGTYRRVAIARVSYYDYNRGWKPAMISARARGVLRLIDMGHHNVGKTKRCAYAQALAAAEARCRELNNARDMATVEQIIGAGGSA